MHNIFLFQKQMRPTIFYKYLLSYVLMAVFFILILTGVMYGKFVEAASEEARGNTLRALDQTSQTVELGIQDVLTTGYYMSTEDALHPYTIQADVYNKYLAVSMLTKYRDNNSFVYDIILYYTDQNDQILTTNGVYTAKEFFSKAYRFDFLSALAAPQDFFTGNEHFLPMCSFSQYSGYPYTVIPYFYPIPPESINPRGYLLFLLDGDHVNKLLYNALAEPENSYSFIFDPNGEVVASSHPDRMDIAEELVSEANSENEDSFITRKIEGQEYYCIARKSDILGWTFVSLIPTQTVLKDANQIRSWANTLIVCLLFAGLFLAFLMALFSYQPIRRLTKKLAENPEFSASPSNMEAKSLTDLSFLYGAVDQYRLAYSSLTEQLGHTSIYLKNQAAQNLINGKFNKEEDARKALEKAGISFSFPCTTAMNLFLDDTSGQLQKDTEQWWLLNYAISNILEELFTPFGACICTDVVDKSVAVLLNSSSFVPELPQFSEALETARSFFQQHFELTFTLGIGQPQTELCRLGESFGQARLAAEQRFLYGTGQTLYFHLLTISDQVGIPPHLKDFLQEFPKLLRQGNFEEISGQLCTCVTSQPQEYSIKMWKLFCTSCIDILLQTMQDVCSFTLPQALTKSFDTLSDFSQAFLECCQKACLLCASSKESKNFHLRDEVISYVRQSYPDENLSLQGIADHFELSPSYLTRFFKDQTGTPLMQYVDTLRMEQAKKLLISTELPISMVAEQSGYGSEDNFRRKFKQKEGLPPSQFRELKKGGKGASTEPPPSD